MGLVGQDSDLVVRDLLLSRDSDGIHTHPRKIEGERKLACRITRG